MLPLGVADAPCKLHALHVTRDSTLLQKAFQRAGDFTGQIAALRRIAVEGGNLAPDKFFDLFCAGPHEIIVRTTVKSGSFLDHKFHAHFSIVGTILELHFLKRAALPQVLSRGLNPFTSKIWSVRKPLAAITCPSEKRFCPLE